MNKRNPTQFLDLSDNEQEIIDVLKESDSLRPTEIAESCSVKRTTVNYNLKKLRERGIVSKSKVGGHYEWSIAGTTTLKRQIDSLHTLFSDIERQEKISIPEKAAVEVTAGKSALRHAYEELSDLSKGERVYTIEGNNTEKQLEKFESGYLADLQQTYKDSGIILEGVLSKQTIRDLKSFEPELLKNYRDRLVVVYMVDDELVDFDTHILIHRNKVKMTNFADELVLTIENKFIKQAMFSLYQALKSLGEKIDLNKIVNEQVK